MNDAITTMQNLVYDAIIKFTEQLEQEGRIYGNAHNFAQKIASDAGYSLSNRYTESNPKTQEIKGE